MLFLLLLEGVLRLLDAGHETDFFIDAPRSGFVASNPRYTWPYFGPRLGRPPIPILLRTPKPTGTYRIFVFGASAAKGYPNDAFSFSRILEAMLRDRFPEARFEVVNTAVTAINSHVVLPIMRDCRRLEPDMYVVYVGNNEVIGPYGPGTIFTPFTDARWLIDLNRWIGSTRTGQLIRHLASGIGSGGSKRWQGMEMFLDHAIRHDHPRLESTYTHYRANLLAMADEAVRLGIPLLLSTVVTNDRDLAPFASRHREDLGAGALREWTGHFEAGCTDEDARRYADAIARFGDALAIDDSHAGLHFRLGRCHLAAGDAEAGRRHLVRARDLDVFRFRADTRINEVIRAVAADRSGTVTLVDARAAAEQNQAAGDGLAGSGLLHEHVHMNIRGNHVVAALLFEKIVAHLPASIRGDDAAPAPVGAWKAAQLVGYTAFFRYDDALKVAKLTDGAPFTQELAEFSAAEAKRHEGGLDRDVVKREVEAMRPIVEARPDDLLTRSNYTLLLMYVGRYREAIDHLSDMIERYPGYPGWIERRRVLAKMISGWRP